MMRMNINLPGIKKAAALVLGCVLLFAIPALAQDNNDYNLSWNTIDGGGGLSVSLTDPNYTLTGTIGQADAGALSDSYTLDGGFLFSMPPCLFTPITYTADPCIQRNGTYITWYHIDDPCAVITIECTDPCFEYDSQPDEDGYFSTRYTNTSATGVIIIEPISVTATVASGIYPLDLNLFSYKKLVLKIKKFYK